MLMVHVGVFLSQHKIGEETIDVHLGIVVGCECSTSTVTPESAVTIIELSLPANWSCQSEPAFASQLSLLDGGQCRQK